MKMMARIQPTWLIGLLVVTTFTGCLKDNCTKSYTYFTPVYKTTAEVRANIRSNAARAIENPGKLYIKGSYIFLNEIDKGIHVIDNSNPRSPKNIAFIDIPGNMDLAAKGNTLYADLYTDMVTLDITDAKNVTVKKIIDDAFPFRRFGSNFTQDTSQIIVDWQRHDTTVSIDCNTGGWGIWMGCPNCLAMDFASNGSRSGASSSPLGLGGSMARFAIVDNTLYTVTNSDLNVFNIANAQDPAFTNKVYIGWNIETIYPLKDKLFIGANTGMSIYSITNPSQPVKQGEFLHAFACDPVVADNDYAYVTLRSGTLCRQTWNQLDIVDIGSLSSPSLIKSYSMTNPHGLSIDGHQLFVCDGEDGLKLYDVSDVRNAQLVNHLRGLETYDVIAWNKLALVVAKDGLYQYEYDLSGKMVLLSKIGLKN